MNKITIFSALTLLLIFSFVMPKPALAWTIGQPIVPQTCGIGAPTATTTCPGSTSCPCGLSDFFVMISNIYSFIVIEVATPLAILSIVVGGVMILLSAGNPNIQGTGKKILVSAIIGLVLVFASWAIINTVLTILGYKDVAHWNTLGG